MKQILIIAFLIIANILQAQELETIELLAPESKEYADLHFLNSELKEKRLVMLGEQTHAYGSIFEMKARVVEYLHKELGYTTFAMEAPMYDIWLMNKEGYSPKAFNKVVYGVWSSSREFQRLVEYIDTNNIKVIGFDSQIGDTDRFIEDFLDYLEVSEIGLKLDEDDFAIAIEGVLENFSFDEDDIKYPTFEKEMTRIIKNISHLTQSDTNYHWLQFAKSLLATTKDAHHNQEGIETEYFVNSDHNIRDVQMADNLLSYLDRNPNEKVICWADNIHIMNSASSIDSPIASKFVSMGTHIKKTLKHEAYSLATLHANDSLFYLKWHKTPVLKDSFEEKLDALNLPYLFIDANQESMNKLQKSRLVHYQDFTNMKLSELHDGYIFFSHAKLPKHVVTMIANAKKVVEEDQVEAEKLPKVIEKIQKISDGKMSYYKGQLIDRDTKEPIPFATLIMKKEETYRVANIDGYFKLPINDKVTKSSHVTISSIGFESKTILLSKLTAKVTLTPKYGELDAVVISGSIPPKTVLKNAIKSVNKNHPLEGHNFYRYANTIFNQNDITYVDLEFITKDYDQGYHSLFRVAPRLEQKKWNQNLHKKLFKHTYQFYSNRENAIRYSNILHKRKYKKFNLTFIKSKKPEDKGMYIIAFKTDRNKWNYTNRSFPTQYSGKIYIRRGDFSIIKVIENWATTLDKEEVTEYFKGNFKYQKLVNKKQVTIKEEQISTYSNVINSKNYASNYFSRIYVESIDKKDNLENTVREINSYLYDVKTGDIEEIPYSYSTFNEEQTELKRVKHNPEFWDLFYKSHPEIVKNK